jgi:DNA-binding NtrC family response regulator
VLSADALEALMRHAWPGNVRELRNVIERAMVLATRDVIDVVDLPHVKLTTLAPTTAMQLEPEPAGAADERAQILNALEICHGNQTHAAKLLSISRRTLINKLEKFALPRPRKRHD